MELKDFMNSLADTPVPKQDAEYVELEKQYEEKFGHIVPREMLPPSIKIDDIKLLVPQTEELVVFELTTALGEKKYERSLQLLNKLMGSPEQNSKLFALLSVTFQRMFFASISKNMTDLEIANKFGVKEYAIKKCKQQCKNFSVVKLKNIVYKFCDVEFMIKSGKMNIQNALFYMVAFILE